MLEWHVRDSRYDHRARLRAAGSNGLRASCSDFFLALLEFRSGGWTSGLSRFSGSDPFSHLPVLLGSAGEPRWKAQLQGQHTTLKVLSKRIPPFVFYLLKKSVLASTSLESWEKAFGIPCDDIA